MSAIAVILLLGAASRLGFAVDTKVPKQKYISTKDVDNIDIINVFLVTWIITANKKYHFGILTNFYN